MDASALVQVGTMFAPEGALTESDSDDGGVHAPISQYDGSDYGADPLFAANFGHLALDIDTQVHPLGEQSTDPPMHRSIANFNVGGHLESANDIEEVGLATSVLASDNKEGLTDIAPAFVAIDLSKKSYFSVSRYRSRDAFIAPDDSDSPHKFTESSQGDSGLDEQHDHIGKRQPRWRPGVANSLSLIELSTSADGRVKRDKFTK